MTLGTFPFFLSACSSQGTNSDSPATTQPAKTAVFDDKPLRASVATLVVHGMSCPQCSSNVDKQLLAVKGVEQVHVNLGTGQVTVQVSQEQPPTASQLAAAIKKSGYTLVRIDEGGRMPLESLIFPKTATVK
jgi:copper chaperone CopZ